MAMRFAYSHVAALMHPAWLGPDKAGSEPGPVCRACHQAAPKPLSVQQRRAFDERGGLCPACALARGVKIR